MLAQFGAATKQFADATVHGNLEEGVQFIGQSQGLVNDVATVDEIVKRCIEDAEKIHNNLAKGI